MTTNTAKEKQENAPGEIKSYMKGVDNIVLNPRKFQNLSVGYKNTNSKQ
jgi:hypothetical protein